ncbi:MAG: hypothetical protein JO112_17135 [Planctomycetes bacterium]|nr:hypothetical protein [Planctomycetota bacterium]
MMPRTLQRRRRAGRRPEFTPAQILAWADAHHRRTGKWPNIDSGLVQDGPLGEKWRNVDTALRLGLRGLPGGSSLAQFLAEHRQVRNQGQLPPLKRKQILAWVDAFHQRTGKWPNSESGPIDGWEGETWRGVDQAMRVGLRGLPGGSSLARFLDRHRGVRNLQQLPRLKVRQILAWADEHHRRTGTWPNSQVGAIEGVPGETWKGVASALLLGRRGLPGGSSLARLLAKHRGLRNPKGLPTLTVKKVLAWARAHKRRTGQWPTRSSGPIPEAPGETWSAVNAALAIGCRGLPAGLTLADLLAAQRVVRRESRRPPLTVSQILGWADAHYQRTGSWPHARSGPILEAPGETWRVVDQALHKNQWGLTTGKTLVQLLSEERGLRIRQYAPSLTMKQILAWADAHYQATGLWPNFRSGPIEGSQGETWRTVDTALRQGSRGLPGGVSLARLLALKRHARNRTSLPPLEVKAILAWADDHQQHTGAWPNSDSGPVRAAPEETWKGIDMALRWGYRGLRPGMTLARLLAQKRGVRNRVNLPTLTPAEVWRWASAYYKRHGIWPNSNSGKVPESPKETWHGVDLALKGGYRGLPGGSSLAGLIRGFRQQNPLDGIDGQKKG